MKRVKTMSKTEEPKAAATLSTDSLLLAMLTLMIDERERSAPSNPGQIKTELLLASSGLTYQQIAAMMNKSPDAVRMMLARLKTQGGKKKAALVKAKERE
jgi:DNA-directed RNA polymerase specialized sigma24 family protein